MAEKAEKRKNGFVKDYLKLKGGFLIRGRSDNLLFVVTLILIVLGIISVFSATYASGSASEIKSQLIYSALGIVFMIFVSFVNFRWYEVPAAYLGTIVMLPLVVYTSFRGEEYNGTRRSLDLGPFQFQPSDLAKVALILALAYLFDKYHDGLTGYDPINSKLAAKINNRFGCPLINKSLFPIVIGAGLTGCYAIGVQIGSHLSCMLIMLVIGATMFYYGGIRKKWIVAGVLVLALCIGIFLGYGYLKGYIGTSSDTTSSETDEASSSTGSESDGGGIFKEYQYSRIKYWRDKDDLSIVDEGYGGRSQTNKALAAITSGGFFGKGFGKSTLNSHVGESQNDFIFSIIIESFGFLGGLLIMILFAVMIWRIVIIGINCPDRYGSLVALGVASALSAQVFMHIAVNIDLLPNTGITLPFFSSGGTSMVVYCTEIGIVLSISKNLKYKKRILKSGDTK